MKSLRQPFLFFIFLFFPVFSLLAEPVQDQEILSKVIESLQLYYYRPLTSAERHATSLKELFSRLDPGTRLQSVKPSESDFVRGLKEEKSISKVQSLPNHAAYIQILFLGRRTANDFERLLQPFLQEGIRTLVLDLRNNPGGSLEAGVGLMEHFVSSGELLFTFEGRDRRPTKYYSKRAVTKSFDLILLINAQTASTAEMMADSLRRYAHATLIGEPTYGKRSVQEVFAVDASHILFLTTGHFVLADGSQEKIQPDLRVPSEEALGRALSEITRKEMRTLNLTGSETSVSGGKAVKAAAAPQL